MDLGKLRDLVMGLAHAMHGLLSVIGIGFLVAAAWTIESGLEPAIGLTATGLALLLIDYLTEPDDNSIDQHRGGPPR